jgi:TonB family protein
MSKRDDLPPETTGRSAGSPAMRLIRYAASRAPAGLAERLAEEWAADLAEQRGALNRMLFALGCCWAREMIGHQPHLYGARLSAATHCGVDVIHPLYPSPLPRRAAVLLIIVLLHIAAAFALIYAVKVHERPLPQTRMIGKVLFDPEPVTPPPPLPRPQAAADALRIPALPVLEPPQSSITDSLQPTIQPVSALPTPSTAPVRRPGGIGKGFPDTVEYYPAGAMRLGEAGLASVSVCVDDHGRLTADPKIAVSSGSPRLDSGALALARAGSGHYRSATENGKAINACFQIGVRFALKS